ncbi:hypothetical protein [Streptomyces neyagawaensis]|uniref:hypothetical protein n=1 Tax=Streptomyces neyagawaensis TaxID=42238 RepID=UPI0006E3820E|nr:hypothetical protein [Streptomyces neyagawaensis]
MRIGPQAEHGVLLGTRRPLPQSCRAAIASTPPRRGVPWSAVRRPPSGVRRTETWLPALDLLAIALSETGDARAAAHAFGAALLFWERVGHPQRGTPEMASLRDSGETRLVHALARDAYTQALRQTTRYDARTLMTWASQGGRSRTADGTPDQGGRHRRDPGAPGSSRSGREPG